jgi:GcrA cell cycle regulator
MRLGDRGVMTVRTDFALLWNAWPPSRVRRARLSPCRRPSKAVDVNEANKPMNMDIASTGATWTTERVQMLRSYVTAGLTCSQIAAEIGVTRNAVIGKVHRMGLTTGGRPGRRPGSLAQRMRPLPAPAPRRQSRINRIFRAIAEEGSTVVPFPGALEPPAVESAQRCSLLELAGGCCRWPLSDPGKADFAFCGNAAIAGISYCAGHARIAYRLPSGRRA